MDFHNKELNGLYIVNYYIIQPQMLYMFGAFDRDAKLCTIILNEDMAFIVDKAPLEIVKDTIAFNGSNLKGALAGSKHMVGTSRMRPLMVNYLRSICVFPIGAYQSPDCIWINPTKVLNASPLGRKTLVDFPDGSTLIVNARLTAFNAKVQKAEQLKKMSYKRGMTSSSFVLNGKKRNVAQKE
jgi:competence protein ComK